ncbi:uncharacterized protein Z520_08047 [Fonsecaea multimorphosa CBS 102226]|uniref:CHL4 family chromosome segregation protein n=1 Tax=Fonsecaea multimorphosa CBS 102226 TaxID=1442371 RepID=A0A0D2K059_9EURO|nr:uncharacterized protein Z520_08047 [Fonsecaea multimorphosa CBS 102226]KIX96269.1 hypothetical protein Z520_08047 [Fonsecaea multimorphosa CBS 102226]OAL21931.1 hypothetical protein AYO22_07528 [Fonsecaea multimorphosa]
MAPILAKSLNRLPKETILELALTWLEENHTCAPYLRNNRTGFEADEEDYLHTPADSIEELRQLYDDLKKDVAKAAKRDIIDRIVDGDWRRGLSLHQHAMIDFAALEQNDNALRWSALRVVPLEVEEQEKGLLDDDDSHHPKKRRKLSHRHEAVGAPYPQISPQAFLSALKAEISPLVKAHYHLHRMPPPYQLTILRLYITPNSAFAPRRSKIPTRAKHATDAGRIMYIALPDSCPYIYISISGSPSSSSSNGRSNGQKGMMAKVDMAAMKRIVLEAIPKALSRPQRRWALDTTKLVARSLRTMCELRGNHKPGTGGGAYSAFADGATASEKSPVDVLRDYAEDKENDERLLLIEKRFGNMSGEHHAPLDRVHVKLCNAIPIEADGREKSSSSFNHAAEEQKTDGANDITLTFSGSDVFLGLKTLAELGPEYIDLDKLPSWMTGESGVSSLTV